MKKEANKKMNYNFENLKRKATAKEPIGKWKGKEVHPISFENWKSLFAMKKDNDNYYYCIYDDNNYLINKGNIEGRLFEDGNIDTVAPRVYWLPSPKKPVAASEEPMAAVTVASGSVELNVASIINEVDALLTQACSWTVGVEA